MFALDKPIRLVVVLCYFYHRMDILEMSVIPTRSDKDQLKLTMKYYCNCPRRVFTGKLQSLKSYVFSLEKNTILPVAQSNASNRTFLGVKKVRFHALQISIAVGFEKK